jgi:hypothetical protein
MSLLKEIDIQSRLRPLKMYLEDLEELGIDPKEEIVLVNIQKIVLEICEADENTPLEEVESRSEFTASQELMRGRGILDPELKQRKEMISRSRLNNPRLGLQSQSPEPGDRVKLAGGGGIGQVVGVKGDAVAIKNKQGYTIETPIHTLRAHNVRHPQTGENVIVWIEEM